LNVGLAGRHRVPAPYALAIPGAISYIGHATLLFELPGGRILTDPVLRMRVGHIRRRVPLPPPEGLRSIDAVLISHAHHDHLDVPSLRRLNRDASLVVPSRCRGIARRAGFRQIIEAAPGQRLDVGDVSIQVVPATHDGRRYPWGRWRPAVGYVVEGEPSVYFAGDTDLFPEMRELAGRVDVAALPVWGWGPRVGRGHLDPDRAAEAVRLIRPRVAIPIHWGTMRVMRSRPGKDPLAAPHAFARAVERLAPEVEVRVLAPGETASV
jgi:L-ascorbate metabolism protein UlaG (beta-lactamase superfamily)